MIKFLLNFQRNIKPIHKTDEFYFQNMRLGKLYYHRLGDLQEKDIHIPIDPVELANME